MICQECHKNEAQIFFKQIINNQVTQQMLCGDCAQKKGLGVSAANAFLDMLAGLGGMAHEHEGRKLGLSALKCSCGMRYGQLQDSGLLGCPECYTSFQQPLSELFKRIHGSNRHMGKRPATTEATVRPPQKPRHQIEDLRRELQQAVAREDFETAARLRDRIRKLEASQ